MKKKLLCQLMAITIVGTMISGEALAAQPGTVSEKNAGQIESDAAAVAEDTGNGQQSDTSGTGSTENNIDDSVAEPTDPSDTDVDNGENGETPEEEEGQLPENDKETEITDQEEESTEETESTEEPESTEEADETEDTQEEEMIEEESQITTFALKSRAAEYSGSYNYVQPNDSVTLSPSSVKASDVVDAAVGIISQNEGSYTTVSPNDVGALSIGKLQWHGQSALTVLREIIQQDKAEAKKLLGTALYNEAMSTSTNWSSRILTSSEASKIKALLGTSQSKTIQDKIERSYIASYVNHGINKGLRNAAALVYYADLANQGGTGGAGRVAANAYNLVGSYSKVTLNELYISATTDDVLGYWASKKMDFRPRRARVYGYSAAVGWSYHNANDTIIPYATLSSSNSTGAEWLQWAMNEYTGTELAVTGKYDSDTIEAVKDFQKATGQTVDGLAGYNTIDAVMEKIVNAGRYYVPGVSSGSSNNGGSNSGSSNNSGSTGNSGSTSSGSYTEPTRTLNSGSTGDDVKWLQNALNTVMGADLDVDGQYGSGTKTAVTNFQKKTGLSADGIFGTDSRNKMKTLLSVQSSKPTVTLSTKNGQNTIKWSKVSSASGYKVYRKTSGGSWKLLKTVGASVTSYTDTTAAAGTAYYYTAKAYRTDSSLTVNGKYVTNAKITTSSKSGSSSGSSSSGSSSTSSSSYTVPTRTLKSGTSGSDVKWLQSNLNNLMGTTLEVDGQYGSGTKTAVTNFQKKTGLSADGIFGTNSRNKMKTLLSVQSSKPTVTLSTKNGQNTIKWSKVSGASGYKVYRKTSGGSWKLLKTVGASVTSYTDTAAAAGTAYYYTAKAYRTDSSLTVNGKYVTNAKITTSSKSGSSSGSSSSGSSSTSSSSYTVPTRTLKSGTSGSDVKWLQSNLNNLMGTTLEVDGQYGSGTKTAVTNFQKKTGLSADGIFGTNSRNKMKTLLSVQSSKPTVTLSTKNGQNTIKWSKVSGASGYKVYRKTSGGSWKLLKTVGASVTSYTDKTPKAGTKYYYTVKAYRTDSKLTVNGKYVTNKTITTSKSSGTSGGGGTSASSYPVPSRTLKSGSSGNDVKWLQSSLNSVLGTKLDVDGIYGTATKNAVRTLQKKAGISVDGIFGTNSLSKLKSMLNGTGTSTSSGSSSSSSTLSKYTVPTRTLKSGSSGNDVKWVQCALNQVLGTKLDVDGIYGTKTKEAVRTFQKKVGISVDGIFGVNSRTKMKALVD